MVQRWEAFARGQAGRDTAVGAVRYLATAQGFNRLARATDVIGPYQGNVAAAKRSWAKAHKQEVVGFIRAYAAAIDWLYDGANREEAVRILVTNLPQISPQLAQQSYDVLLDPERWILSPRRARRQTGSRLCSSLRSRYGEPKLSLTDPMKYYDPSLLRNSDAQLTLISLKGRT